MKYKKKTNINRKNPQKTTTKIIHQIISLMEMFLHIFSQDFISFTKKNTPLNIVTF